MSDSLSVSPQDPPRSDAAVPAPPVVHLQPGGVGASGAGAGAGEKVGKGEGERGRLARKLITIERVWTGAGVLVEPPRFVVWEGMIALGIVHSEQVAQTLKEALERGREQGRKWERGKGGKGEREPRGRWDDGR